MEDIETINILKLLGLDGWVKGAGWSIGIVLALLAVLLISVIALVIILIVKNCRSKPEGRSPNATGPREPYRADFREPARAVSEAGVPPRQTRVAGAPPVSPAPRSVSSGSGQPDISATTRWGVLIMAGGSSAGRMYPLEGDTMIGRGAPEEGPYPGYVEDEGRWMRFIRLEMDDRPALAKQCSRKHFRIRKRRGMDGVFDVEVANQSGNPLWVDGKMLKEEGETAEARDGSVLELAPDWKLKVCRMA